MDMTGTNFQAESMGRYEEIPAGALTADNRQRRIQAPTHIRFTRPGIRLRGHQQQPVSVHSTYLQGELISHGLRYR